MKISNRAKSALATAGYSVVETSAIAQLAAFAAQNSGIDFRNYYDPRDCNKQAVRDGRRAYASECRSITADWKRFKDALIQAGVDCVTDADVIAAAPQAFSGRLEWRPKQHHDTATGQFVGQWDYCTGQYFPTEYRKAAATLLETAARLKRASRPPEHRMPTCIAELRALNRKNGGCWFEPGTMRFFGTRICGDVQFGRFFITSEQPPHGPRQYSVRSFNETGDVETEGEFGKFETQAQAQSALRKIAGMAKQPIAA